MKTTLKFNEKYYNSWYPYQELWAHNLAKQSKAFDMLFTFERLITINDTNLHIQ